MQNYGDEINHYNEAQERLRSPYKKLKRKKLHWVGFEGNHENRIKQSYCKKPPNMKIEQDKVTGCPLGIFKRPTGSTTTMNTTIAPPQSLITVVLTLLTSLVLVTLVELLLVLTMPTPSSTIVTILLYVATAINVMFTSKMMLVVLGWWLAATKDTRNRWAGQANLSWWNGVVLMREVDNGRFEPMFISMDMLEKEYGND